jgi:hypothetical protein
VLIAGEIYIYLESFLCRLLKKISEARRVERFERLEPFERFEQTILLIEQGD